VSSIVCKTHERFASNVPNHNHWKDSLNDPNDRNDPHDPHDPHDSNDPNAHD